MAADDAPKPNLVSLKDAREEAIAQLSDAFANDVLDVDEFERRLTLAHRANTVAEIGQTVSDLASPDREVVRQPDAVQSVIVGDVRPSDTVMAIFGGVERRGPWTVARHVQASALMGGMVLDFRDAVLPPGVTEVHVLALMGGAQIIVPPHLAVEVSGTAIFGGFGHVERVPSRAEPDRPVLRVHGLAVFGGVAVETRLAGESDADAHARRRREGRALGPGAEPRRLPASTPKNPA